MKVVLFCGGLGMRLREYSEHIPKPLVSVGSHPIMWHLMKYYAHHGHKEFILCLGYGAAAIKKYFMEYQEYLANDFTYSEGGRDVRLLKKDIADWRITFVDTGVHSNVGERLRRVREYLGNDEIFLANYADGLSDLDLTSYIDSVLKRDKIASFVSVPVPHTFHIVRSDAEHHALTLEHVTNSNVRINGGFFVFRKQIFEYMKPGEELVVEPFQRLMEERQLLAVPYEGFWRAMDTFKDKINLDDLAAAGGPWEVWKR